MPIPPRTSLANDLLKVEQVYPEEQKQLLSGYKLLFFFVGMCLAIFLAALDQTIVATAMPKITSGMHYVRS